MLKKKRLLWTNSSPHQQSMKGLLSAVREGGEAGKREEELLNPVGLRKETYLCKAFLHPYHSASTPAVSRNKETHSTCVPWCHIVIVLPPTTPTSAH